MIVNPQSVVQTCRLVGESVKKIVHAIVNKIKSVNHSGAAMKSNHIIKEAAKKIPGSGSDPRQFAVSLKEINAFFKARTENQAKPSAKCMNDAPPAYDNLFIPEPVTKPDNATRTPADIVATGKNITPSYMKDFLRFNLSEFREEIASAHKRFEHALTYFERIPHRRRIFSKMDGWFGRLDNDHKSFIKFEDNLNAYQKIKNDAAIAGIAPDLTRLKALEDEIIQGNEVLKSFHDETTRLENFIMNAGVGFKPLENLIKCRTFIGVEEEYLLSEEDYFTSGKEFEPLDEFDDVSLAAEDEFAENNNNEIVYAQLEFVQRNDNAVTAAPPFHRDPPIIYFEVAQTTKG